MPRPRPGSPATPGSDLRASWEDGRGGGAPKDPRRLAEDAQLAYNLARSGQWSLAAAAFGRFVEQEPDHFWRRRPQILALLEANDVEAGGLMSFNLVHENQAQRAAAQLDKVLRGMNPAEIPFELPTKSEFAINLGVNRLIHRK